LPASESQLSFADSKVTSMLLPAASYCPCVMDAATAPPVIATLIAIDSNPAVYFSYDHSLVRVSYLSETNRTR
jgi:hypothetical protein